MPIAQGTMARRPATRLSPEARRVRQSLGPLAVTPLSNRVLPLAPGFFDIVAGGLPHDLVPLPLPLRDLVTLADGYAKQVSSRQNDIAEINLAVGDAPALALTVGIGPVREPRFRRLRGRLLRPGSFSSAACAAASESAQSAIRPRRASSSRCCSVRSVSDGSMGLHTRSSVSRGRSNSAPVRGGGVNSAPGSLCRITGAGASSDVSISSISVGSSGRSASAACAISMRRSNRRAAELAVEVGPRSRAFSGSDVP